MSTYSATRRERSRSPYPRSSRSRYSRAVARRPLPACELAICGDVGCPPFAEPGAPTGMWLEPEPRESA